jgi:hypothetical protein
MIDMDYQELEEIYNIVLGAESLLKGATHNDLVHRLIQLKDFAAKEERWKKKTKSSIIYSDDLIHDDYILDRGHGMEGNFGE